MSYGWSATGRIGSSANNSTFEADGTLVFHGTATQWKDCIADILTLQQTGTGISTNAAEGTVDYITAANTLDYAVANCQLNHERKSVSSIYPHIHWFQAENNTPNWLIQYRIQLTGGGAKTTSWTNYKCNTNAFTYTSGTINQISSGAGISVSGTVSDIIQLRIIRDSNNTSTLFTGADPYTLTASVMSVDIHYECDTSTGSRQEFIK